LESTLLVLLSLIGILLACAAFVFASEAALFSLSTVQVERFRERGGVVGRLIASMLQRPTKLIFAFLVGKATITVGLAVTATSLARMLYGQGGEYVAIVGATVMLLVSEVTPKHLGMHYPQPMARLAAWPVQIAIYALTPVYWSLRRLVHAVMGDRVARPILLTTPDELKTLVEINEDEGVIDQDERHLIQRVFEFGAHRVSQIMTPRTDIFALEANEPMATALPQIKDNRFSRIPVYEGSIDQIIGILYAKDLLSYSRHPEPEVKVRDLLHPAFFVPESKRIDDLLREFQRNKVHMAIVVDEIDPQTYVVSAKMAVTEFNETLGVSLPREDADTIGGHVFHLFGMLPKRGESVSASGLTFTIEHIKGTRILEIRVHREGG
jgi:magnesium and cobalt exporter, CNNM family